MKKNLYLIPFLFLLWGPLPAQEEPVLRIGGSDLFGESFQEALEQFGRDEALALQVELNGSFAARSAMDEGALDLALLAVPSGSESRIEEYESYVVAYQTVVFGIHPDNPLNELTMGQIAGIFGAEELTSPTRWGDLGLTGDLGSRSISLHSVDSGRSIAVDLFRHEVLRNPRLRGGVNFHESMDALLPVLVEEPSAIGLLPKPPPSGTLVRTLSLARDEEGIAFGPTRENVHTGDYPIRLPIHLVFPAEAGDRVRELLLFLTRENVAGAIEESGLLPLPSSERNRLRFEFEQL